MGMFYRPWWGDRLRAAGFLVLAAAAWAIGVGLFLAGIDRGLWRRPMILLTLLTCVLAALLFVSQSRRIWRRAAARHYGAQVEHTAGREARRLLRQAGWNVRLDVALPGSRENIDLLARRGRSQVLVEIKSFHAWGGGFRETKTLAQVRRQMEAMNARQAVVWLPQSRSRVVSEMEPGIFLVCGSARRLADVMP